jgi:hypothetical protein
MLIATCSTPPDHDVRLNLYRLPGSTKPIANNYTIVVLIFGRMSMA